MDDYLFYDTSGPPTAPIGLGPPLRIRHIDPIYIIMRAGPPRAAAPTPPPPHPSSLSLSLSQSSPHPVVQNSNFWPYFTLHQFNWQTVAIYCQVISHTVYPTRPPARLLDPPGRPGPRPGSTARPPGSPPGLGPRPPGSVVVRSAGDPLPGWRLRSGETGGWRSARAGATVLKGVCVCVCVTGKVGSECHSIKKPKREKWRIRGLVAEVEASSIHPHTHTHTHTHK